MNIIKIHIINTALISLSVAFQENPLANIKRVDCAMLPPCRQTLEMKIQRSQYVATLWMRAMTAAPGQGISPIDYGWSVEDKCLKPTWFEGPAIPRSLFTDGSDDGAEGIGIQSDDESGTEVGTSDEQVSDSDDEAWSEGTDTEDEDEDSTTS